MAVFKDATGREWRVTVNVAQLDRVKQRVGVNLSVMADGRFGEIERLAQNPMANPVDLCNALFVLCEEQARERGVSDVQFGELLAGDVLEQAADSLYEAFAFFCPSRVREPLLALARKNREIQGAAAAQAMADLAAMPDAATCLRIAIASLASSASTPAGSPSASSG